MTEFTIMIPSSRPELATEAQKCLAAFDSIVVDGTGAKSYSEVANRCIAECPTELVFICNDKGRPTEAEVLELHDLVISGYGMAWLHPFGFGGYPKETIRKIGFYDERYVDGNFEDCDLYRRLREENLAIYEEFRIKWVQMRSSWSHFRARIHFERKWSTSSHERRLPEEDYPYDLGPSVDWQFLDWTHSKSPSLGWFNDGWDSFHKEK